MKKHLEEDFPGLAIKVDLFVFIDTNKSIYASLETLLYRFRYAFVVVTQHLKADRAARRMHEDLQAASFDENWTMDRIVPIWTSRNKKHCPIELRSLKGISYFMNAEDGICRRIYLESVEKHVRAGRRESVKWEKHVKDHYSKDKTSTS